jgi:hypothetical protein
MAASFFIVAEFTAEGGEFFFVGEALVYCHPVGARRRPGWAPFRHLDALAREAGVRPLSEFISEDPETAGWRFFGDLRVEPLPGGLPATRWFTAGEGHATVRRLLDYLTTHTERVADVRQSSSRARRSEIHALLVHGLRKVRILRLSSRGSGPEGQGGNR